MGLSFCTPLFPHYSSAGRPHAQANDFFGRSSLLQDLKLTTRLILELGAVPASGQQGAQRIQATKTCISELEN